MHQRTLQDDFVLTVSDNDDLAISDLSEDVDGPTPAHVKRKRTNHSARPRKKLRVAVPSDSSEEDRSEENKHRDAAFDSDFEFDLGFTTSKDNIEDFNDSGDDVEKQARGDKPAVDMDEVIARKAAKLGKNLAQKHLENGDSEVNGAGDSGHDQDTENSSMMSETMPDFGDDDLLADDAFGAQADSENEHAAGISSDADEQSGIEASDDESVASPTAHPDDEGSDDDISSQASYSSMDSNEVAKQAAFFASEEPTAPNASGTKSVKGFHQFSLSRPLLRALTALAFHEPTPIQVRTVPLALRGLDVVASARTGSGKTAAFLLPIFERLLFRSRKIQMTRVVILMPTRELAVQCYNVATALARYTDITFAQIVGGFSLREQESILKKRPDVVIATPGRFIDHMRNSASFQVENIEILVLDEADRMLEDGFADELDEILKTIPKRRQTMLFSATMTEKVDTLVRVGMDKPVRVNVDAKKSTVEGLSQEFVRLRPEREQMRLATLCVLCKNTYTQRTIVFFREKKEAHRVRIVLGLLGLKVGELHGNMSQEQRNAAVTKFRDGKTTHLLATDLASRGLDIRNVESVVNYGAPQSHDIYLHRVGRTARAGRTGRACTIAIEQDRRVVKAVVKAARSQNAKVVSRTMNWTEVSEMQNYIESLADEIEEVLQEEKEVRAMAQAETQITRAENMVKHEEEIMSRPKRTWFESEKEKQAAREKGKAQLNGVTSVGGGKKLSNKIKKQLDSRRERQEGGLFKKSKGSMKNAQAAFTQKQAAKKAKRTNRRESGGKANGKK